MFFSEDVKAREINLIRYATYTYAFIPHLQYNFHVILTLMFLCVIVSTGLL